MPGCSCASSCAGKPKYVASANAESPPRKRASSACPLMCSLARPHCRGLLPDNPVRSNRAYMQRVKKR